MKQFYWYINRIGDPVVLNTKQLAKSLADAERHVRERLFCEKIVREMKEVSKCI